MEGNNIQNWFESFNDLKKAIEDFFDYQIDFYYKDKMCTIGRDNSEEVNKKYGHDIYYIAGWEKNMKKTFDTLEDLSKDQFFEVKTLLEVSNILKFDNPS